MLPQTFGVGGEKDLEAVIGAWQLDGLEAEPQSQLGHPASGSDLEQAPSPPRASVSSAIK